MSIISVENRKWFVITAIGLMNVIGLIDFTAINLAIVPIVMDFHATLSEAQWINNITGVVSAAVMIIAGRLSDIFGKKNLFIIGVGVFVLGSIFAGFADNQYVLIISRALQGIGVSIEFPVGMAIVFSAFPEHQRGLALGLMVTISSVAQAIGPLLGGFMIDTFSWRYIFYINIPLGLLSMILTYLFCVSDQKENNKVKIDVIGGLLLIIGLLLILTGLNEAADIGIGSNFLWTYLLSGSVSLVIFYIFETNVKYPLVDMSLFKNKNFLLINTIRALYGYVFLALLFILGLYLQNILGYNPLTTGLLLLTMTIIPGVISPFVGKLIDKYSAKIPIIIGMFFSVISLFILAKLPENLILSDFIVPLTLFGISFGIVIPVTFTTSLRVISKEKTGVASGIFSTISFGSGAVGVACTGLMISVLSPKKLYELILQQDITLSSYQMNQILNMTKGLEPINMINDIYNIDIANNLIFIIKSSFIYAFELSMWVCVILSIIGMMLAYFVQYDVKNCKNET